MKATTTLDTTNMSTRLTSTEFHSPFAKSFPAGRQMLKKTAITLACCGILLPALSAAQTFGEADLQPGAKAGYQEVDHLTVSNGSTLNLIINGLQPATPDSSDTKTHTVIHVTDSLKWGNDIKADIVIGSGNSGGFSLLDSDVPTFHLAVLTTDSSAVLTGLDGTTAVSFSISDENITITDTDNLLTPGSSYFSWIGQQLYFTGTINTAVVENLFTRDRSILANTLWSSTHSVTNFAATAVSQLSTRKNGHSGVWVSGLGDFANASGKGFSQGYKYSGGGYALGADHAFTSHFIGGLAFGQTFGTNKAKGNKYASTEQNGIMGGLYTRFSNEMSKEDTLFIDSWIAYGSIDNKGQLQQTGDESISSAKWLDNVVTFGTRASWQIKMENLLLTPFIGIEYSHGEQNDIVMNDRRYYDGAVQNWTVPVGITCTKKFSLGGEQYLIPEITVAYEGDISRQNAAVATDIFGKKSKAQGVDPGQNAILGNVGLTWMITSQWSAGACYNLEKRSSMTNQSVSGMVRFSF